MRQRGEVVFYLNGIRHVVDPTRSNMMLADYLRRERTLTGTKIVCAEGDCGACSVLKFSPRAKSYIPINSCIAMVSQMDACSLVTVDALAAPDLTSVQKAMMNAHASQCGFCTPGFVMALTGLVEKKLCSQQQGKLCTSQEAKNATTGNLCRCTGYQPILDAATSIDLQECKPLMKRFYSTPQDRDLKFLRKIPLLVQSEQTTFFAPTSIREAIRFLRTGARVLGSLTDLGVVSNKGKIEFEKCLSLHLISDLDTITEKKGRVIVGANVSLSDLRSFCKKRVPEFANFLDLFASPQIKNIATLIGNVVNASPIADTPPFLLITDAQVTVHGTRGKRVIPIHKFFLGYRKTALKKGEIVTHIDFEIPDKSDIVKLYKVSQRKDLDISTVNAAFRYSKKYKKSWVAFGGIAATPLRLLNFEKALFTQPEAEKLSEVLQKEIFPISDLRGSAAFRRVVSRNLLLRFLKELS